MNSFNLGPAEARFQRLANRIAKMAGIPEGIEVYTTEAPNACATFFLRETPGAKKPVIAYNPVFIDQLRRADPLAIIAAFAQEVAYIYNHDLHNVYAAKKAGTGYTTAVTHSKISVDKFTGWVLWHEGVQLRDAKKLYELPKFNEPHAHLPKHHRRAVMKAGWVQAHERMLLPHKHEDLFLDEPTVEFISNQLIEDKGPKAGQNETGSLLAGLAAFALLAGGVSLLSGE